MFPKKGTDMMVLILRYPNMVVLLQRLCHCFAPTLSLSSSDFAKSSFSALNPSYLLHKLFPVCATIPGFWFAMF
jgi:hypothetical protein